MSAPDFTTDAEGRSTPCAGSATRERLKARMAGMVAALEGRKLDANHYHEDDDLHFEWLDGWTGARMEMRKSPNSVLCDTSAKTKNGNDVDKKT